ncbi:MAG: acyl--CoA ligase, partial [Deltaproteobacteria bacterium]|nr:acyl--CoA ligase [Deltaproteobacteria bacterium]
MIMMDAIAKNARLYPDKTAFVEVRPVSGVRKEIAWASLYDRVNKLAHGLTDRGVSKGDKVFILGKNAIHWLETYFAVMSTGALAVPLNYRFTDENILYCADVAEPVAFLMDEEYAARKAALRPRFPTIKSFVCMGHASLKGMENTEHLIENHSPTKTETQIEDTDECALYFTSGTTGEPKPVLLMHKNLMCAAITEATNVFWKPTDTMLMLPPFYHLAIGHLLGCILAGGKAVLLTEKIAPDIVFENIAGEKVSLVFLLVPWVLDILDALDRGDLNKQNYHFEQWRLLYMGAQPIPGSLVQRWEKYFPDMQFDINYGLSEAGGPGAIHLGIGNDGTMGAIGKPSLIWDLRIVDDHDEDVPEGEVGEIILKGAGIMKAYYKNPDLTRKTVRNGWLYTGDLAKNDK